MSSKKDKFSFKDKKYMRIAINIAKSRKGLTGDNPSVGCVIVKNDKIISHGVTGYNGRPHAETNAISNSIENLTGSKMYVTLEPCNHFGRTPPCTEALMWAGVREVVVAHYDPNPTVRGKGIQVLQDAGIDVRQGLLEEEAAIQMHPFLHWCRHRRPLVTVKMAVDANGSVDDRSQNAQRFTSDTCLDFVHALRKECDAVLVGVETVVRDNPQLTVRRVQTDRQPLRIIIDPNQRTPKDAILLTDEHETLVMGEDFTSLSALLNLLGDKEIQRLMVEGGPTTVAAFLDQGFVDEFYLIHSEVNHLEPIPSNIDAQRLTSAGLSHSATESWGEETVHLWTRA